MKHFFILLMLCVLFISTLAYSQLPQTMSYQGYLSTVGGLPVHDSSYTLTFKLYNVDSGGTALWTEAHSNVVTAKGTFNVILGSVTPLTGVDFNQQLYVGITKGSDPEFSPRSTLTSSPSSLAPWASNGSKISYSGGNVGIGTTNPTNLLHLSNGTYDTKFDGNDILFTRNDGPAYIDAINVGGRLDFVTNGRVPGDGNSNLVLLDNQNSYFNGNVGIGTSNPSYPLDARRTGTDWTGQFLNTTNNARAYFSNGFGYGAFIDAGNNAGSGTYALNVNKSGTPYLYVRGDGKVGVGTASPVAALDVRVDGAATATGTAIRGQNTPTSGVYYGVYGISDSPDGFGVASSGSFFASGTKSFRIDHPQDPSHRYLLHYSAESPDVLNMYTGNVITDANGYATITLPDYYKEINKDPRYLLTVINEGGTEFVQAMVVQEIRNNQFAIRTSKSSVKVSWRVDAVRNDQWVRTYGAPVEVEKKGFERGKYQHPELYGMPKEMGMNYRPEIESARGEQSHKSLGEVK